ncbi:hypothetical protein T492DRAFT_970480 [Pavlovales sp. CCMP2436]|nr:hypothetical protein T492DRAFT_970480 [Pavlovales sp. CCMP2436]
MPRSPPAPVCVCVCVTHVCVCVLFVASLTLLVYIFFFFLGILFSHCPPAPFLCVHYCCSEVVVSILLLLLLLLIPRLLMIIFICISCAEFHQTSTGNPLKKIEKKTDLSAFNPVTRPDRSSLCGG